MRVLDQILPQLSGQNGDDVLTIILIYVLLLLLILILLKGPVHMGVMLIIYLLGSILWSLLLLLIPLTTSILKGTVTIEENFFLFY